MPVERLCVYVRTGLLRFRGSFLFILVYVSVLSTRRCSSGMLLLVDHFVRVVLFADATRDAGTATASLRHDTLYVIIYVGCVRAADASSR